MEITKLSAEVIKKYFTSLSQFGYKSYHDVDEVLVLLFIEEILTHDFLDFITEEDYKDIVKALYCLFGSSCLIHFPKYINSDTLIKYDKV